MNISFQRIDAKSNAHAGRAFEIATQAFFRGQGIELDFNFKLPVGIGDTKKDHAFDLGCIEQKIIVECKSHRWTTGDNIPSAKLTVWNEAMYYFNVAPSGYRKIMFVLKDASPKRNKTLAEYYWQTHGHLVPDDVELWEYDETAREAEHLKWK